MTEMPEVPVEAIDAGCTAVAAVIAGACPADLADEALTAAWLHAGRAWGDWFAERLRPADHPTGAVHLLGCLQCRPYVELRALAATLPDVSQPAPADSGKGEA